MQRKEGKLYATSSTESKIDMQPVPVFKTKSHRKFVPI